MKKLFMVLGFLTLFCVSLSARYIFDGKIVFSKHATNKDSLAYLIIEKAGGVLDTFAVFDTLGNVTFIGKFLFDGNLWLPGDTLFFTDGGADTSFIVQDGTYLKIGSDNSLYFNTIVILYNAVSFYDEIYGYTDNKSITWAGWQWKLDYDNDDSIAYISFHNEDSIKVDTSLHVMEWTGSGGISADVIKSVICDTVASAAMVTLGEYNNFVISGTADIDSIDTAGAIPNWGIAYIEFTGTAAANGIVDGKNLKIAGNFAYSPDDMIIIQRRGNIFYEMSRSPN